MADSLHGDREGKGTRDQFSLSEARGKNSHDGIGFCGLVISFFFLSFFIYSTQNYIKYSSNKNKSGPRLPKAHSPDASVMG